MRQTAKWNAGSTISHQMQLEYLIEHGESLTEITKIIGYAED